MIFNTEVGDVRLVVRFHQQERGKIPYRLRNLERRLPPNSEKVIEKTTLVKV